MFQIYPDFSMVEGYEPKSEYVTKLRTDARTGKLMANAVVPARSRSKDRT
jgi:hypothetical protein